MDIPIEKKKFNKKRLFILMAIIALLIITVMAIMSGTGSKLNVDSEHIIIGEVSEGSFQENIPVSGTVLPIKTIFLDALEGGRVEEIFVEDGAIMKKGDPILKLSNTDLELSLINQETSVYNLLTQMQISQNAARQNTISRLNQQTDVENALIEAKRIYELNKKLYEQNAIGGQEFKSSKNDYEYQLRRKELSDQILKQDSISNKNELSQAKSSYARTQRALDLMRRKVEDLLVRAPLDGQLTSLDAEVGESKNKGERLGQIDVLSGYKITANIDEHYVSKVHIGQRGSFLLNGKNYELEIKKIYIQVTNGKFQVDMGFVGENPEGIRRGQTIQILLALSAEKQTVRIPKGGFYQKTGGNWIFKVSQDGESAFRVPIQLGSQNTEYYEVLEGLLPGDKVITSSYANFGDKEELIIK
ncbi:HlyD family secretion protein [Kordia periserrulae]|uniref:HlyD family secretion protein n=1 Tax=Kordia periserrulae TaxID=701523 RepID=A0A2T6C4D8_9FLAO|nr:HlyD family efflux transporter periplasmic adaptor subunit [Kordia periserrulae]PTX63155.1 HlyD family secretion protein [Kordia periserrulae]